MSERETLWTFLRRKLLGRTYTDQAEGPWDYAVAPEPFFATCGYCGWDGPCRDFRHEAERDRWRHPDWLCWLRALWLDRHGLRVWR